MYRFVNRLLEEYMDSLPAKMDFPDHSTLVKLAREIAIEHKTIEKILQNFNIPLDMWETQIKHNKTFLSLLDTAVSEWQSALNTYERTKLKAAATMEDFIDTSVGILNNDKELLSGRVELAKLMARIAGMGLTGVGVEGATGEKLSVTINIGENKLRFEKQLNPPTIDGEVITDA